MKQLSHSDIENVSAGALPAAVVAGARFVAGSAIGGAIWDGIKIGFSSFQSNGRSSSGGQMNRSRRLKQSTT
ncbi:hypothetical protein [Alteromonas oceanisediminis]|uniref:hypothetical protein n=1 Tax=Alteromonas oceanisediminis TaxID=2836180 RepID=UPI001BD9172E|nr:hypothetical protein [Alteromonas oceanisediminis]MBT0585924.1 hypothetical protein [Alteromonas oceanisediminis]